MGIIIIIGKYFRISCPLCSGLYG